MTLLAGGPAPIFVAPSKVNPRFAFSTVAGRYVLLVFLPPAGPEREAALALLGRHLASFTDEERIFFGVLPDREGFEAAPDTPPWRWFLDESGDIARKYRMVDEAGALVPGWVVLDPSLRVMVSAPLARGAEVIDQVIALGAPGDHAGVPLHAPVLIAPRIFEPSFCRQLIEVYETTGGAPSGVMRERDGKTIGVIDDFKRRRDVTVADPALRAAIRFRLSERLLPEIEKAFAFKVTRVERYTVACYAADEGGYFKPHTDNGAPGTAHRRFACSINLNTDFEGGDLYFPEFGPRPYRPPLGGAVVFSCSLLHGVKPITRGRRYAYLPFFYDEEGRRIRDQNLHTFEPPEAEAQTKLAAATGAAQE